MVFADEIEEVGELRECVDIVDETLVVEDCRLRKEANGGWKERLGRRYVGNGGRVAESIVSEGMVSRVIDSRQTVEGARRLVHESYAV